MKYSFLKMIAFTAIAGVVFIGCQKEELNSAETGLVANSQAAVQQNAESQRATITVDDVKGDYKGVLDEVVMNGNKKSPVYDQLFSVEKHSNGKFNLYLPPFKIGNMPGTITIDTKGITLNNDGSFRATNLKRSVILNTPISTHRYTATLVEGKFTKEGDTYKLTVGIHSEGKFAFITLFTAYVHYDGKQVRK